jgi:hypothetical protein
MVLRCVLHPHLERVRNDRWNKSASKFVVRVPLLKLFVHYILVRSNDLVHVQNPAPIELVVAVCCFADDPNRDGPREVFDHILTWFLSPAH